MICRFLAYSLLILLSIALATLARAQAVLPESASTITLATHSLCPYGCYLPSKNGEPAEFDGIAIKTVTCALADMNWQLKIRVVPWARAQKLAQSGAVDGFFAASQKDSRDEFAVMSDIIADQKWRWYLLADSPLNPEQDYFKQVAKVGGFAGSNMLAWLTENGYRVIAEPPGTERLLRTLMAKRVDAILANERVMTEMLIKQNQLDMVKSYLLVDKPLGVYFNKRFVVEHPEFLDTFNHNITDCRHD